MAHTHKVLLVLCLTTFGLWGCSKGGSAVVSADRVRHLESQVAKLEADMKALSTARDTYRAKLTAAEGQARGEAARAEAAEARATAAEGRATAAERERDALTAKLKEKATERDQLQAQFEGFRRDLKDLIGRTDAAIGQLQSPGGVQATPVSTQKPAGQSSGS